MRTSQITLRVPYELKVRAIRCAVARRVKLTPWLEKAIVEKCEREEVKPTKTP